MKNIFDQLVTDELINRIQQLTPVTKPKWGKMSADQMLAHCNVAYIYTFTPERFKKPSAFKKFLLKTFVKNAVASEKPYPKNSHTAPEFLMTGVKDFEKEKAELIANIQKNQKLGIHHFEGLENFSFGKMTANEWNNLFYKHFDYHLTQFGV